MRRLAGSFLAWRVRGWPWCSALAVVSLGLLVAAASALGADRVYWGNRDSDTIGFANLDNKGGGGGITPAAPDDITGVAIDAAANKIYWANYGDDTIASMNLDGTDDETLDTRGAPVDRPWEVAIDPAAGKIYWANTSNGTIGWADLDRSGGGQVDTGTVPVVDVNGIAIDKAANRIYWANYTADTIAWVDLGPGGEGTGNGEVLDITPEGLVNLPNGLAIDSAANRIYWNEVSATDKIASAKLDGTGAALLDTAPAPVDSPELMAIDPAANKIYWANAAGDSIGFANLHHDGETLNTSPIQPEGPVGVALLKRPDGVGAPAVSGGSTTGSTLSCSRGAWAPDLVGEWLSRAPASFSYSWTRGGAAIAGATSNTLVASSPGAYACHVTAHNHAGASEPQTSAAHGVSHPTVLGPDLELTKTAATHTVHPGGQVTYRLVVRNHGPGQARGVMLEDLAPFGVSFTHVVSKSQGACTITTDLHCDLGALANGDEALVEVASTVAADAPSGLAVNHATVWGNRGEANESNDTASSTVHVTPVPPSNACPDPTAAFNAGFSAAFEHVWDRAFNHGFDAGFRSGFDRGFHVGLGHSGDVSAQAAASRALAPECDHVFNQGFNAGWDSGFNHGFNRGFNVGFNSGFNAGHKARHRG